LPGATAPVQAQGPTGLVQFAFDDGFIDEAAEILLGWWWFHAQQLSARDPPRKMLRQQLRCSIQNQDGFEQAIRQLQASITQRKLQVVWPPPASIDPSKVHWHARASSRGCSFQFSSSASPSGSESATMPQPAWARRVWPDRMSDRIRMLLSKRPSQSM